MKDNDPKLDVITQRWIYNYTYTANLGTGQAIDAAYHLTQEQEK